MFELIAHCYKNFLDRCDDFGQSFCQKVIILKLQLLSDTASHTILTSAPYFVIFLGLYIQNFRWPCHGIMDSSSDSSCFLLWTDLNFYTEYSYMGYILNSCLESFVCWLLSLKCQANQIDSKWFLHIVWGKMGVEIVGWVDVSDLSYQNY